MSFKSAGKIVYCDETDQLMKKSPKLTGLVPTISQCILFQTEVEVTDSNKQTNLLSKGINHDNKKFYCTSPSA